MRKPQLDSFTSFSGTSEGSIMREAGGIAPITSSKAFIASYAVGLVVGSGSVIDTSTASISGMVLWKGKH